MLFLKIPGVYVQIIYYFRILTVILACILISIPPMAAADLLEDQRILYRQATGELAAGNIKAFRKTSAQLQDYPLYPYLVYNELSRRIRQAGDAEISDFLERYPDLPVAQNLRTNWLKLLAQGGKWQTFYEHYQPPQNATLQCYFLQARMQLNRQEGLLEDIRSMWLAGKSQPAECDPAFELLYDSELMTDDLVWERIRLAMANNKPALTGFLGKRLDEADRQWVSRWINMHANPAKWTHQPGFEDKPVAREILVHGINRLANRDIDRAIRHWDDLQAGYSFTQQDIALVRRTLAIRSARNKHERAMQLLDQIADADVDEDIFHWRLATTLANNDWQALLRWTAGEPPATIISQRWHYWHSRALEESGKPDEALSGYQLIKDERDYYGFLVRDRLGLAYEMNHHSQPEQEEAWREVARMPPVIRARELYMLGLFYAARREWHQAYEHMSNYQLQIAAAQAAGWGWHDRSILTLGRAMAYDDLTLRFPVVFEPYVRKYAEMRKLDLGWMYALVRAESAFMVDARSPAGALGLMQVMPATGKQTARSIGFRTYKDSYLLEAVKNITIGSAYLQQMYEKFNNSIVLATAAYNAGPNAVMAWLPGDGCVTSDVWIEQIPYAETRKYVSRILYYASIYDWRLQQEITPVMKRMSMIPMKKHLHAGGTPCSTKLASLEQ